MSAHLTYTPARIDAIDQAALELSHLGALLEWTGHAVTIADIELEGPGLSRLGCALQWAGGEIERRCAIINKATSNVGEWKP
ncbi:hypothetical protein [Tanticharoenia sakaeratensis]|uniref:Uncharacterized protein n=1 Tax=Tanticharoenia sakaeratensis NBRC 103193 TaxID=1231623 RepID=A0A0D6MP55_9PROT|nr:hypothetical protein [Tanticharoenia sakaeratensis]GAN55454.1 hypothetical protein Tasa_048_079 [Tanticharoenia sakaeratensis NBRC 103193]GBQ22029.1 hypothetical protein AA103193_1932 [Tanticharoenia sakaeratensis NBRC 103193]